MKGMQKISRGDDFRGVLDYAFRDPNAVFLGANCLVGETPSSLADEFAVAKLIRPDILKPVWHSSLRLPPDEKISRERILAVAHDYMRRMEFGEKVQYVVVMHDDPQGQHVHIIASRVRLDKTLWHGKNENLISTRVIQELEKAYGLTVTAGPAYQDVVDSTGAVQRRIAKPEVKRPKKGELQLNKRMNDKLLSTDPLPRIALVEILNRARGHPELQRFVEQVEQEGAEVFANITGLNKVSGLAFSYKGQRFKGSDLGGLFAWKRLATDLCFDAERDLAFLRRRCQRFEEPALAGTDSPPALVADILGPPRFDAVRGAKGTVLYVRRPENRHAMTDMGQSIVFKDTDADVIRAGLKLGTKKWPQGLTVSGSRKFKEDVVRLAVEIGMEGSITNPDLRDAIAAAVEKRRRVLGAIKAQAYVARLDEALGMKEGGTKEKPKKIDRPLLAEGSSSGFTGQQPTPPITRAQVTRDSRDQEEKERLKRIRNAGRLKAETSHLSCGETYLALAHDFLIRDSDRTLDAKAWRAFDRSLGSSPLYGQFSREEIIVALTTLSPAALVSLEAMQARLGVATDATPIIETYGQDVTTQVLRASPSGLK